MAIQFVSNHPHQHSLQSRRGAHTGEAASIHAGLDKEYNRPQPEPEHHGSHDRSLALSAAPGQRFCRVTMKGPEDYRTIRTAKHENCRRLQLLGHGFPGPFCVTSLAGWIRAPSAASRRRHADTVPVARKQIFFHLPTRIRMRAPHCAAMCSPGLLCWAEPLLPGLACRALEAADRFHLEALSRAPGCFWLLGHCLTA